MREAVGGGERDHSWLGQEDLGLELGLARHQTRERDIDVSVHDRVEPPESQLANGDRARRFPLAELTQRIRQQVDRRRAEEADRQARRRCGAHGVGSPAGLREEFAPVAQQHLAGGRELDTATVAVEQQDTELLFEPADLLAE